MTTCRGAREKAAAEEHERERGSVDLVSRASRSRNGCIHATSLSITWLYPVSPYANKEDPGTLAYVSLEEKSPTQLGLGHLGLHVTPQRKSPEAGMDVLAGM